MRISIADPVAWMAAGGGSEATVKLDGRIIEDVLMADEEAGLVECFLKDDAGLFIADDDDNVKVFFLYGCVQIEMPKVKAEGNPGAVAPSPCVETVKGSGVWNYNADCHCAFCKARGVPLKRTASL